MTPIDSEIGVILIDHGSKRDEANAMLLDVVRMFREVSGAKIVEPAHMELARPALKDAFAACIKQGAKRIVIHPYFLAPGNHSTSDIPRLAKQAAADFPGLPYTVTDPLGLDLRMGEIILSRIESALASIRDDD